jgi:hypothetical protein
MNGLLAVLPIISHHTADVCVASLQRPDSASGLDSGEILVVDNTRDGTAGAYGYRTYRDPDGHNLGVARSWNIGAREVLEQGLDYLVLMSSSMQFGPILHTTWKRQMETFWGATAIECDGHSWHLIAFHRTVFEKIGLFDENFYPGYFEAIDFGYRMRMVDLENHWPRVWVNALSQGAALHNEIVSCPAPPLLDYYEEKWGGPKGEELWDRLFGQAGPCEKPLGFFEDRTIPYLAAKYELKEWW